MPAAPFTGRGALRFPAFNIGPVRVDPPTALAPMAGHTDVVFRTICRRLGCGLVYTELVSAEGLARDGRRTWDLLETVPEERPIAAQLFGADPVRLADAARRIEDTGRYDLIDLNMGCPVPKVVSRGAGAAIMRDPALAERLVSTVANAVRLPVSAKTRAGWSDAEVNAVAVCRAVEQGGGSAVAVHARTRLQKHAGAANWELLAEIRQAVRIPVLGNGGVLTPQDGPRMLAITGVAGVMLARGALGNPWIFRQLDQVLRDELPIFPTDREIRDLIELHLRGTVDMFARHGFPRPAAQAAAYFRQQLVSYVRGRRGAKSVLRQLAAMVDVETTLAIVDEHFLGQGSAARAPVSSAAGVGGGTSLPSAASRSSAESA